MASKCDAIIVNAVDIVQNNVNDDDFESVGAIFHSLHLTRHDIIDTYHVISSKNGMKGLGCCVIINKTALLFTSIW